MNKAQLNKYARLLIDIYAASPPKKPKRPTEHEAQLILLGLFAGSGVPVKREFHIRIGKSTRPKRVDFRIGGPNPVLIEFAVRPPSGGQQLGAVQNQTELTKLKRFTKTQARGRYLLLVDLTRAPHTKANLQATYKNVGRAAGRPPKKGFHPVRVVYVHATVAFDFVWKP